jgi:phosphatidylserine decarboxylase
MIIFMQIPLTKYGMPQVAVIPTVLAAVMAVYWLIAQYGFGPGVWQSPAAAFSCIWLPELILFIVLAWALSFFRDPPRRIPDDPKALLSPADGTVTDIEIVENDPAFEGRVMRIGIFLSIFNVHINRAPCAVKVGAIAYKPGQFKNAMSPQSGRVNESNAVRMTRTDEPKDELMVRQISGAIARRIVCAVKTGEPLTAGQQFGMLKFGSRTELYVPVRDDVLCRVKIGDKVRAGLTTLVKYK